MSLRTYRKKRDFRVTPEPEGARVARKADAARSFVVQKHAARRLHYDFRLELDGVLKSWAIPKGPSDDPADKRLAVHVEDHPVEYGGFEGVIPERQYGGGTVMLWDRGTWTPREDPRAGYARGVLKFDLHGEKLHGGWALVRTHRGGAHGEGDDKAWLLIKERDKFARRARRRAVVDARPESVATGRNLAAIARDRVWTSAGAADTARGANAHERSPSAARRATVLAKLSPPLATLVERPPAGQGWIHEIKFDGYRLLARIDRGNVRLISRNGNDWTKSFPAVADALARANARTAWIDGEVCVLDEAGRPSFQALQNASSGNVATFAFFAFDLPYCDGRDLRRVPLTERKRWLRRVVGEQAGIVRLGPESAGDGAEFLSRACELGFEGIVSKRADGVYRDGVRTREWLKIKCVKRQEMVIGGYTAPQGTRKGFGALLLGHYEDGRLRYAGKVGTGFDARTLEELHAALGSRERAESPFSDPPHGFAAKDVRWVEPDLVAEVGFTEWSNGGALRHPSFEGLRMDKKAKEVVRERPVPAPATPPPRAPRARASKAQSSATIAIEGITISHPDKLMFPECGVTKKDLAEYYAFIASRILPYVEGRPLSLVRCPDGWSGTCFFQKHADPGVNAAVDRLEVPESKGTATYMAASTAKALVALAQWGVVEVHPWGSKRPRLDRPDRLILDLDPADGVDWAALKEATLLVRKLVDGLGLSGFPKTTGGKGLHVVVPIRPTLSWEQAKGFTRAIAEFLARGFPDRFVATADKHARHGKIFIDYLRNAQGATAVAPYSVRARKNAPIAMAIGWHDLGRDVRFDYWNVRSIRSQLARRNDPWADFAATRQQVSVAMARRVDFDLGGTARRRKNA